MLRTRIHDRQQKRLEEARVSLLFGKPEMGPDTLTARSYQLEAVQAARQAFINRDKSTLVILPTGTGKTVLFSKISRMTVEKGGRSLIIAHRGELIDQAANTLERVGIVAGIEKAESHARATCDPDVVVGTVQTFQGKRLESWDPDYFSLIIVDEAHHYTAESYQNIVKHFAKAKVLGVTATPDRADKTKLKSVFDSVAYEMTIWEAMTAPYPGPYLCRLKFVQCDVGIDLRDIRTTGGDLNQAELEEAIRPHIDTLANSIRQESGSRSTLVFTPDVGSATAMATALQSLGVSADWISGDSSDRALKLQRYKEGDVQVLCNCALLTEGFDAPRTAAIALCRPTKSRSLHAQMVGRGTRLSPEKENCLLIDFNFLTEKHDLVRPADLFDDSGFDPDVLDMADKAMRKKPGLDLLEAVERARTSKEEQDKEAAQRIIQIQARERTVKYRKISYDPLSMAGAMGMKFRAPTEAKFEPPSPAQIELAKKMGIPNPEAMTKRLLSRTIDFGSKRRSMGLASFKQFKVLVANGYDTKTAREMPSKDASEIIGRILGGIPA